MKNDNGKVKRRYAALVEPQSTASCPHVGNLRKLPISIIRKYIYVPRLVGFHRTHKNEERSARPDARRERSGAGKT